MADDGGSRVEPSATRRVRLSPRAQGFLLGFILALLVGAFAGIALSATSNTIKGCYDKKSGDLRVRKGARCKSGELKIAWNKVGPRGPAGPKGQQGEPGLLSSFDEVAGLGCTRGTETGTIQLDYAENGDATLTCFVADVCGNGATEEGEGCDDGNTLAGDGCSDECQVEPGAVCGNGATEVGEGCDDGNVLSGDGCSDECQVEPGAVCGNGATEVGEGCDDGNTIPGDGCSATCQVEALAACGDGFIDPDEQCDDGNVDNGDGCSSACLVDSGWQCTGQPSTCTEIP